MSDEIEIKLNKKYVDFISEITQTKTRCYIHIPAKFIKFKEIDPLKRYRVILIPLDTPEDS